MNKIYITGLEVFDDSGSCRAVLRAEDVCWHVEVKDTIHTLESWAELSADIGRAMRLAHDHNDAQESGANAPAA